MLHCKARSERNVFDHRRRTALLPPSPALRILSTYPTARIKPVQANQSYDVLTINFDEPSAELLEGRELLQTLQWIFLLAE